MVSLLKYLPSLAGFDLAFDREVGEGTDSELRRLIVRYAAFEVDAPAIRRAERA